MMWFPFAVKLPPDSLPSVLVASGEALARRFGIEPERWWRILYRQEAPTELELIGLVAAFGPKTKREDFLLTSQHTDNTIGDVDASTAVLRSRGVRRAKGAPRTKAVEAIDAAGLTFAEIKNALEKRLGRSIHVNSVQAWAKKRTDPAYRRIPDDAATELETMGVPRSVWPSIIPPK
jgi:hypothetical protein